MKNTGSNLFLITASILLFQACTSESSKSTAEGCNPSPAALVFRQGAQNQENVVQSLVLQDPDCEIFSLATRSGCGELSTSLEADTLNLSSTYGFVSRLDDSKVEVCFNKGATPPDNPTALTANYLQWSSSVSFLIKRTPTDIPDLYRWFRPEAYLPATDGTRVGIGGVNPWADLNNTSPAYNANASGGREPIFRSDVLGEPALEICGVNAGCAGVTSSQHMRVASSFNDLSGTDMTLAVVVARANGNANYLLSNQSSGNNTGLFLGWTSSTNLRFGLQGPGGSPQFNVTVPAYSGAPEFEVWLVRINTVGAISEMGLSIFRNGVLMAQDPNWTQQPIPAVTIPLIGTQRSDHNNSRFFVRDFLYYKRALTDTEVARLSQYLM